MVAPPRVKICCISSLEEAFLALQNRATALGFVSSMPSGRGVIEESAIARIVPDLPPGTDSFLLTALQTAREIVSQHARCPTTTIQLVDEVAFDELRQVKSLLPRVKLVKVVHVIGEDSIAEAMEVARWVDELLLDSGNPNLQVKELGGTGRVHDWSISRRICESVERPVYLAGGLTTENVQSAIEEVRPYGLDICSGVRTQDRLDPTKLKTFMEAVRGTPRRES